MVCWSEPDKLCTREYKAASSAVGYRNYSDLQWRQMIGMIELSSGAKTAFPLISMVFATIEKPSITSTLRRKGGEELSEFIFKEARQTPV